MAYPYSTLDTSKVDATGLPSDHAAHHDALGAALNDLLTELGTNPGGASDVTARLGGAEYVVNKNLTGGYAGVDGTTGVMMDNRAAPDRRYAYFHRALNIFLGGVTTGVVKEVWLTDSFGHQGTGTPGTAPTASMLARYEQEMSRAYNSAPINVMGFAPNELWNGVVVTTDGAMAWDDVPAGQHVQRGSCLADKNINAGQHATTTRGPATAVTVYYAAAQTGGAVVTVTLNGYTGTTVAAGSNGVNTSTFVGADTLNAADSSPLWWPSAGTLLVQTGGTDAVITYTGKTGTTFTGCNTVSGGGVLATGGTIKPAIDNRDSTLGAGTFDAGREVRFTNQNANSSNITITLTHAGIGTSFELDAAYFHYFNHANGFVLQKMSRSAVTVQVHADATLGLSLKQWCKNQQPHIITIVMGINDGAPTGTNRTATQLAADLTTVIGNIRAQYSTWKPAIRYVFEHDATWAAVAWLTTYRDALRTVCINNDVMFVDMNEPVGSIRASDDYGFSSDALHPNVAGHRMYGLRMASISTNASTIRVNYLNLAASYSQFVTGLSQRVLVAGTSNPSLNIVRNAGGAQANATQIGFFGFLGVTDASDSLTDIVAATAAVSEEAYTSAHWGTGLRFYTTPTGAISPVIQAGLSGAGDLWVGATTLASATWQVSAGGRQQTKQQSVTLANGSNDNLTLPTSSLVFITGPTGNFNLTGIAGGSNGMRLTFVYTGAQQFTITNQATSTAANQITTLTGADVVLAGGTCAVDMVYDSVSTKWIVIGTYS